MQENEPSLIYRSKPWRNIVAEWKRQSAGRRRRRVSEESQVRSHVTVCLGGHQYWIRDARSRPEAVKTTEKLYVSIMTRPRACHDLKVCPTMKRMENLAHGPTWEGFKVDRLARSPRGWGTLRVKWPRVACRVFPSDKWMSSGWISVQGTKFRRLWSRLSTLKRTHCSA